MNISPIFYQGCKKKKIKEGLVELFPKNINKFIDVFCGSGIVSMNVKANSYVLNDIETNLINLIELFKTNNSEQLINNIEKQIEKYQLEYGKTDKISFDSRSKNFDKNIFEIHKRNYLKIRDMYNLDKTDILKLYTLTIFCFSHQMRFNKNNDFNMPCGHDSFTKDNRKWIEQGCKFFGSFNVYITNKDFRELKIEKLKENDFVYLDPPYLFTTASYNENGGWTEKDEKDLYCLCNKLDENNIKWAMSNVIECKGKQNLLLKEFIKNNKYNVHNFNLKYSAMGKGNSNNKEILITNY